MTRWRDRPLTRGMWLATCFVIGLLLAGGVVLYTNAKLDAQEAKTAALRQQEGRAVAVDVLCGGLVGVEEAGKKALTGRLAGQDPRGSLPASAIREYNATISHRVLLQAGVDAKGVLKPDGTLNCDALRLAARTTRP